MKLLVFEPFSGAAGDMVLGALLDLGVPEKKVADAVSAFGLRMDVQEVVRGGIKAKRVKFARNATEGERSGKKGMSYGEIVRLLRESGLSESIVSSALNIFERIANAEARVHGVPKEKLHFHELGGLDTLGDLVGCVVAFTEISGVAGGVVERVLSLPVSVGGGFVRTAHGEIPVPAPATLEILRSAGIPFKGGPVNAELLTPTGAALLAHFVDRFVRFLPEMRVERTGYGAGEAEFKETANVLRVSLGSASATAVAAVESEEALLFRDAIEVLETNVDDVTGEVLGNLIEVLLAEGAKDVSIVPALMKKGRAGHIIKVIVSPKDAERIAYRIMRETGTLGVRVMGVKHRFLARREVKRVRVKLRGLEREISVKFAFDAKGSLLNVSAEFEDARRIASETGVPLREVMHLAEETARREIASGVGAAGGGAEARSGMEAVGSKGSEEEEKRSRAMQ
ncbi:MAG: nickel pincer cofactor biosynthesis protein LarC [Candidatus Methanospirare jalkutatii]|nr:nickel pincer cofactor biosynthesis protein LarC [Candidatus Methanospirare jalkutatii]